MTAGALRRLLGGLLAGELVACTAYPARDTAVVRRAPAAKLAAGRVGDDGRLDHATCAAACDREVTGCYPATFAMPFPPARPAQLTCEEATGERTLPLPPDVPPIDARPDPAICARACATDAQCRTSPPSSEPPAAGEVVVVCEYHTPGGHHFGLTNIPAGRRPPGFAAAAGTAAPTEVGAYLAHAACLERASVIAFARLERELATHGAPRALRRRARRAAVDERRHARALGRLAPRHGAAVPRARAAPVHARPLLALAIENALEGCIGESIGALLALRQARAATDPRVRRALDAIAVDELAHAQLAWDVHAFYARRLSSADRAALHRRVARAARARAAEPLPLSPAACATLGLPASPALARAATRALLAQLAT